jgi:hypothetical protein
VTGQPPIHDVTTIDVMGQRIDGGLDMVIVVEGPLEGTTEDLAQVAAKVRNYLREAMDTSFQREYGIQRLAQVTILFESKYAIDPAVDVLLSRLAKEVSATGARLVVNRYAEEE